MSEGFARTLETARDAEAIAKLLGKVAEEERPYSERVRLRELAERYTEYAKALKAVVADEADAVEPDQAALAL